MATSLLGTKVESTAIEDDRYIQLKDMQYGSACQSGEQVEVIAQPKAARIVAQTDITVKVHEAI
jgi:hypothetical protein